MGSRGGVLTGIQVVLDPLVIKLEPCPQATRWLIQDLGFCGVIVSTSGDPDAGQMHLDLGAQCNWGKAPPPRNVTLSTTGKPLPTQAKILDDITSAFAASQR